MKPGGGADARRPRTEVAGDEANWVQRRRFCIDFFPLLPSLKCRQAFRSSDEAYGACLASSEIEAHFAPSKSCLRKSQKEVVKLKRYGDLCQEIGQLTAHWACCKALLGSVVLAWHHASRCSQGLG